MGRNRDQRTHEIDPNLLPALTKAQWSAANAHEATKWAKCLKEREESAKRALEILSRLQTHT